MKYLLRLYGHNLFCTSCFLYYWTFLPKFLFFVFSFLNFFYFCFLNFYLSYFSYNFCFFSLPPSEYCHYRHLFFLPIKNFTANRHKITIKAILTTFKIFSFFIFSNPPFYTYFFIDVTSILSNDFKNS